MPDFFITQHSIVPMRSEPRESAEMVSQLLFGEFGEVVSQEGSFVFVKNALDGYLGWVDAKMILSIDNSSYESLISMPKYRTAIPMAEALDMSDQSVMRLPMGSLLTNYEKTTGQFGVSNNYTVDESLVIDSSDNRFDEIPTTAFSFLNSPYLWGGKNCFGIDCSGFVQVVFSVNGYKLPRDASQQILLGTDVSSLKEVKAGDLAFFEKNGKIVHVGILLSSDKIIHASGRVKIEKIDADGIMSNETGKYTHKLIKVKRIR